MPARHVGDENADENERAAEEGIERQLHRAVFPVGRSPDRDQEIFRHDHEFVENEEEEQIGAQENAVRTADDEQEPEKEFVRPLSRRSRKKEPRRPRSARYQDHRQADAVDREMIVHPERRNPRNANDGAEMREVGTALKNAAMLIANPATVRERNPARQNPRQKKQQDRPSKNEVNRPGDHRRLRVPIVRRCFPDVKSDFARPASCRRHQLPDGVDDGGNFAVMFADPFLEFRNFFASSRFVSSASRNFTKARMIAMFTYRALAAQHAREHRHALFREGIGPIRAARRPELSQIGISSSWPRRALAET